MSNSQSIQRLPLAQLINFVQFLFVWSSVIQPTKIKPKVIPTSTVTTNDQHTTSASISTPTTPSVVTSTITAQSQHQVQQPPPQHTNAIQIPAPPNTSQNQQIPPPTSTQPTMLPQRMDLPLLMDPLVPSNYPFYLN